MGARQALDDWVDGVVDIQHAYPTEHSRGRVAKRPLRCLPGPFFYHLQSFVFSLFSAQFYIIYAVLCYLQSFEASTKMLYFIYKDIINNS